MAETVTVMVLKVDLQCTSCYKKIKKILCKFPEIRGQIYDVKQNTVTINVVCCSPEKFRDKLCCKGGNVILCIEIKPPPTPPPPPVPPPPPPPKTCCKPPKTCCKPPKTCCKPPSTPPKTCCKPPSTPCSEKTCCRPSSEGYCRGPCSRGKPALPPCNAGCSGYGSGCGCGRGCHLSFCYIEENPSTCKIM